MKLIKNAYISFLAICILKAVMDGLNFTIPYNSGFFSITKDWWDAWHLSWVAILIIIGIHFVWQKESKWQINILRLGVLGIIAYLTQLFIYNFLFKL